ncbi:hypothetical protein MMC25_006964 [Agyrium rufum]|nr:hypothetical protein [Agyrium rufum]
MSVSVLPQNSAGPAKRPKLKLQTASISLTFASSKQSVSLTALSPSVTDSPTIRNTVANTINTRSNASSLDFSRIATPATPLAPFQSTPLDPSSTITPSKTFSASSISSSEASPFSATIPYTLSIGTRSILRNSPIPTRPILNNSVRQPKRFFPPIKRVTFRDPQPQDFIAPPPPSQAVRDDVDDESDSSTASDKERRTSRLHGNEAYPIEGKTAAALSAVSSSSPAPFAATAVVTDTSSWAPVRRKRSRDFAWPVGPNQEENEHDSAHLPTAKHLSSIADRMDRLGDLSPVGVTSPTAEKAAINMLTLAAKPPAEEKECSIEAPPPVPTGEENEQSMA